MMFFRHEDEETRFLQWLAENEEAIRNGKVSLDGTTITEDTELTRFQAAVSLVVVSFTFRSRYHVVGEMDTVAKGIGFTLFSLLFGWWGVPWGPIFTVIAVVSNLRGGLKSRVRDLFDERKGHQKAVVSLTERAAENATRIMQERGFSAGSGLRLEVEGKDPERRYLIQYDDMPTSDGSDWVCTSQGVKILVSKRLAPLVEGMTIDFQSGDYAFKLPGKQPAGSQAVWDRQLDG
jgi:Fe-S cluster assembly iron-binding protein IscA